MGHIVRGSLVHGFAPKARMNNEIEPTCRLSGPIGLISTYVLFNFPIYPCSFGYLVVASNCCLSLST